MRGALLFLSPLAPQILSCPSKIALANSPIQDRRWDLLNLWEDDCEHVYLFSVKKYTHLQR